ncbi:TetR/AcrR family transcriptional regulator [Nakamurella aerolata]|uniref:TetR/AcrR family transcriptional regulator n=1 Tax=Nakamurella aerolata TaxID=1656892 RepID=A0A849A941_9ACTN|nr:TetR/AcrR family transcriptional regulator [Nakamurella aerolata]NNG36507.1 TetR/AcrR family transcriptional regulator [Nakamurella aerolata]
MARDHVRESAEQIDNHIVDVAAGLFAVHGFERTSVQQIADAVGYSKTGLLHRFPSKEAIRTAVHQRITDVAGDVLDELRGMVAGPPGLPGALRKLVDTVLTWPGGVNYLIGLFRSSEPGAPKDEIPGHITAEQIVEVLAGNGNDVEVQVRVILALETICAATNLETFPELRLGDRQAAVLADVAHAIITGSAIPPEPRPPNRHPRSAATVG